MKMRKDREATFLLFLVELVKDGPRGFRKLCNASFRISNRCSSLISTSNSTQDWAFAKWATDRTRTCGDRNRVFAKLAGLV